MREITEEVFLKDVANHAMTVLKDAKIYRHLRFANRDQHSWNQWFEIVTWPGTLAYNGDMGTFVFSRLEDMFEFFRVRPADEKTQLHINLGYWAEKLQAVDRDHRNNSEMAYSEDIFKERVEEHIAEWIDEYGLTDDEQKELRSVIADDVLSPAQDGEHAAHEALRNFVCEINGHRFEFSDTWEWNLREYTLRFVWCCYAIAWGINQYDAAKSEPVKG